ncbi:hypothetical protein LINPERHAP2_LOCUS15206, partial [Linum perenne]
NCLGALDGTHVKVCANIADQPRYRNRKGEVSINVLGVCNPSAEFIYYLAGWEGSDHDGRVLRDALSRPNGLKKVDANGKFANGAYVLLERLMLAEKPNCGVKATPNIVSRCKTLKAKFLVVQKLRGLSGACWDDVKKMVDIEDTSYAEYVEKHSHCAKLNRVPFPCYDGLKRVFGKVRAIGKKVVGNEELDRVFHNIEEPTRLLLEWTTPRSEENQATPTGQQHHDAPENPTPEEVLNPRTPTERATHSAAATTRKRARWCRTDDDDDITELKPAIEETMASLKEMLGEVSDVKRQRSMLYTELEKIDGLTTDKVVDASLQLRKDDGMLQVFFSLADHVKKRFIERMLQ